MADDAKTGDAGSSPGSSSASAGKSSGKASSKTRSPGAAATATKSSESDSTTSSASSARPAPPLTAAQLAAQADSESSSSATGTKTDLAPTDGSDEGRSIATTSDADKDAKSKDGKSDKAKRITARSVASLGGKAARVTTSGVKKTSDAIRTWVASLLWLLAVLAAIVLAVGALIYALDANRQNDLVQFVLDIANRIDGPFWRIFEFTKDTKGPGQPHDKVKEHLVNWGLAAVAYLIAGRILDRVIRP